MPVQEYRGKFFSNSNFLFLMDIAKLYGSKEAKEFLEITINKIKNKK